MAQNSLARFWRLVICASLSERQAQLGQGVEHVHEGAQNKSPGTIDPWDNDMHHATMVLGCTYLATAISQLRTDCT